eukprot:g1200.t1
MRRAFLSRLDLAVLAWPQMSTASSVQAVGAEIGLEVGDVAAAAVAREATHRGAVLIEAGLKFMRHGKRRRLTVADMNKATTLLESTSSSRGQAVSSSSASASAGVSALYGFSAPMLAAGQSGGDDDGSEKWLRSAGGLVVHLDKQVPLKELANAPLPACPVQASLSVHWLAINGVMPAIPQNVGTEAMAGQTVGGGGTSGGSSGGGGSGGGGRGQLFDAKSAGATRLTNELRLYFDRITSIVLQHRDPAAIPLQKAYRSVAEDPGLGPLVPYFTQFISQEVNGNLRDLPLLNSLLSLVDCLLENPHMDVEAYNHWALRDHAATVVAKICKRYSERYHLSLQPRITKTLHGAFRDRGKPLTTHYGAIRGLMALGPLVVERLLLPHMPAYLKGLEEVLVQDRVANPVRRMEAWRCYGLLLEASGQFARHGAAGAEVVEILGERLLPYTSPDLPLL